MLKSFESLGIPSNHHHRVIASNIPQLLNASKSGHLIFHPEIRLEAHGIRPKPHQQNIYYYSEAACLLSHLNAIKRAYEDGHDLVLFLEDDAVLSTTFLEHWRDYVNHEATPDGWKILQFATVNPHVIRQGVLLREHFVSWQPYHWSTRAYVMNREGMQTLMEGAYVSSSTDNSRDNALGGWQIPSSLPPMVVADEVIYSIVGDAYTSTGLWVDSFEGHGSTVQSKESNADVNEGIMHSYSVPGDLVDHVTMKKEHDKFWFEESLLVMMNVRVSDEGGMERDIRWIRQDFHAACRFHRICNWEINVVIANPALTESFRVSSSDLPPNIHFHTTVSAEPFNKFSYVRTIVDRMDDYDLVLLKDNDLRISGFPWRTFVERKENAVVSGPLRQSLREAMAYNLNSRRKSDQKSFFHEAHNWVEKDWSADLFANVMPTEVPIVEMYFVLFDGAFAKYFFDRILTPEFVGQSSDWGPDLLWCTAAKEWDDSRPSCYLVPLVSGHEDSRQIDKRRRVEFNARGDRVLNAFRTDPHVGKWMRVSTAWHGLIHSQSLQKIKQNCRDLLGIKNKELFDLQACTMKLIFSFQQYGYVPQISQQQQRRPESYSAPSHVNVESGTGSWANCSSPKESTWEERKHHLTRWEKHRDSSYTSISCTGIHYRIPGRSLHDIQFSEQTMVIGVLSGASGEGPNRRRNIRSTWASGRSNVLFVVAGPWSQIEEEYEKHGDLLWLDMDEIYLTEISHLTFKTESFFSILYERVVSKSESVQYLFKTDDDSYVALEKLYYVLLKANWGDDGLDYWGKCKADAKPHRNQVVEWQKKWFIPYEVYTFDHYPTFAMGAGYALSRKFLSCAFGNKQHAARIRYMPNEDVAVGMLAERCNVKCTNDNGVWIRYDKAVDGINMDRRIVQHYVKSEEEMRIFHNSLPSISK